MRETKHFRALALVVVLALALLIARLVKTFAPFAVLPTLNIPGMVLLSLLALLFDHYLVRGDKGLDGVVILVPAVAFGLLPLAADFATAGVALKLAVVGGVVFTVTAWLFAQLQDRLCDRGAKLAPVFSALGMYLAAQCFSGVIL